MSGELMENGNNQVDYTPNEFSKYLIYNLLTVKKSLVYKNITTALGFCYFCTFSISSFLFLKTLGS